MTTTINASTSSGLVNTADTSGVLQLQTASTAALTIDASQNVGIGTASPTTKLDVTGNLKVTNSSGSTIVANRTANPGSIEIQYGGTQTAQFSAISGGGLEIYTGSSPALRMSVNAYGIGLGTAVPSSGTGITFPATQSASSNANTLDDYEEGTFTPTMSPTTGSWTTSSTTGRYVKVGQTVTVFMSLTITTVGTGSGFIGIDGFPFVAFNPNIGAGNRAAVGIVREDAVVGYAFQIFINGNTTLGNVQGFVTPTTVSQGSGYVYEMSIQYITSS